MASKISRFHLPLHHMPIKSFLQILSKNLPPFLFILVFSVHSELNYLKHDYRWSMHFQHASTTPLNPQKRQVAQLAVLEACLSKGPVCPDVRILSAPFSKTGQLIQELEPSSVLHWWGWLPWWMNTSLYVSQAHIQIVKTVQLNRRIKNGISVKRWMMDMENILLMCTSPSWDKWNIKAEKREGENKFQMPHFYISKS